MNEDTLGLFGMIEDLGGIVNLTVEEREAVTSAQAEALQDKLSKVTKDKHYRDRKTGKVKHLADSVITGTLEGEIKGDGSTSVGFSTTDANHARIARMLNDGTKKMQGDSFWDETVDNSADGIQDKGIKVLSKIIDDKGKGL